jgi:hypothetical protein
VQQGTHKVRDYNLPTSQLLNPTAPLAAGPVAADDDPLPTPASNCVQGV